MAIYKQFKEVRAAAQSPREEGEMVGHVVGRTLIATVAMIALAIVIVLFVSGSQRWAGPIVIGCALMGLVVGGMWGMRSVVAKYTRVGGTTTTLA
ncbi:MAG: hypothetical protein KBE09_04215 [Candidatus Pacebacteria bacterium]|nr:hypothetical protein [Candidatus Paceibacterota bacterium]